MATEGADRGELAGLGPAGDCLRVNAEHGGDLCGGEERLGVSGAVRHELLLPPALPLDTVRFAPKGRIYLPEG